jgi:hypothetical protein
MFNEMAAEPYQSLCPIHLNQLIQSAFLESRGLIYMNIILMGMIILANCFMMDLGTFTMNFKKKRLKLDKQSSFPLETAFL